MKLANTIKGKWGKLDESWRFAVSAFLIARIFYGVWSWVILTIQPIAVHYVDVNNQPAVIFLNLHTIEQNTYLRNTNGAELDFRSAGRSTVKDLQTGSTWDIHSGLAIEGYFKGTSLTSAPTPADMFPYYQAKPYPNAWLAMWQRFDVNWYVTIAKNGYGTIAGDHAFPPLFPLLINALKPVTHGNDFLAGLIISHIAALFASKLLYTLTIRYKSKQFAQDTLFFLWIFPTSFFFFSVYTESLFLVFTLLALLLMKNATWHWSAFFIFCASLTRVQGVALIIPIIYLMMKESLFLRKYQHWFALCISSLGTIFYFYFRSRYTLSLAPSINSAWEPIWHWKFAPPWEGYWFSLQTLISGHFNYIDFLNFLFTTCTILLLVTNWKKLPLEYNLFTITSLLIMLTRIIETKPLHSMLRYLLTIAPSIYVAAFLEAHPWRRRIVVYSSLALNLYLSAEFFGWGWVA